MSNITQSASAVLMVRPANFGFNEETAASNAFQHNDPSVSKEEIQKAAIKEFDDFVKKLQSKQIEVLVFEEKYHPNRTDAIFPNNWISMHSDARVILYPMESVNRRLERNNEILDLLETKFEIDEVLNLSQHEKQDKFLEGTGSIIFDYQYRKAYACRSSRTDEELFKQLTGTIGFSPVTFDAVDAQGKAIYHTNVMMAIGTGYAVVCLASIHRPAERELVRIELAQTKHEIIDISYDQLNAFAGNMLEVKNKDGQEYLVMSQTAFDSLSNDQIKQISKYAEPLPVNIPTIEKIGGGSARCMMAAVHLPQQE